MSRSERNLFRNPVVLGMLATGLLLEASAAGAVDWSKASARDVALFFPGQMSWEKVIIKASHKGADKIRAGESCGECHAEEAAEMGASQAEASAYTGRSAVTVQVKAAIEADSILWQISGPVAAGGAPSVALMLGNATLKSTAQAGCWAACHDDAPGMASDAKLDLGKYIARSRSKNSATGGGNNIRPQAELDAALAAGEFLDLIELEADGKSERGPVLERFNGREVAGLGSVRVEGDRWIAEIKRPLAAGGSGEIALQEGAVYHFGIAIHDSGAKGHQHLVSLAHSLAVGGGAGDVVAGRQ